jgi:glyceraldehyde-3-phosphate dehydrogenase (NADP+)
MKERRGEVVKLLLWEIGKSLRDSEKEFDRTLEYVRDTIEALREADGVASRFQVEQGVIAQIRRAPLGVALCMGPFNYPLNETLTTLLPALVMGNTVVMKPPRLGVLLFRPLLEAMRDAFPRGVVNTVYGDGPTIIGPLMSSGKVDVLAFIGSARVAAILEKQHPKPNRLRTIYGLEAKNPAVILPDADLDLAVKECVLGSLSFNGQRCTALKILFVHRDVANPFVDSLTRAVGELQTGMPWEPGVAITPLAEASSPKRLADLVEDAVRKGARARGGDVNRTFFRPALVEGVAPGMRLWSEEQFGPVVPVATFDDLETPVRFLVESPFGQQMSIFGRDAAAIARLIDPLVNQVCRVNLNSQCQRGPDAYPFTGRKDSAEGTLSVTDALRCFSIRTMVAAKEGDANRAILEDIVRNRRSRFLWTESPP